MRAALTLLMMGVGAALLITGFNGARLSDAVLQVIRGEPITPSPLSGAATTATKAATSAGTLEASGPATAPPGWQSEETP